MQKIQGIILMVISIIGYSILVPLIKKANQKVMPFTAMAISMAALFFISLLMSLLVENGIKFKFAANKNNVLILLVVGLVNAAAFYLYIVAFKYMPIWQQSMFQLLTPVLGGVFAYFLLGEALSINLLIGLMVMGLGLFIAVR